MGGLLTAGQLLVGGSFISFLLGFIASPYIRDWWNRVPAPVRAGMDKIEAALQAKVAAEVDASLAKLHSAAGLPVAPVAPPVSPVVTP
jgi:hypothetical protein